MTRQSEGVQESLEPSSNTWSLKLAFLK